MFLQFKFFMIRLIFSDIFLSYLENIKELIQFFSQKNNYNILILLSLSFICLIFLLILLKNMINNQIQNELDEFSQKARIPDAFRKNIAVKIKFK